MGALRRTHFARLAFFCVLGGPWEAKLINQQNTPDPEYWTFLFFFVSVFLVRDVAPVMSPLPCNWFVAAWLVSCCFWRCAFLSACSWATVSVWFSVCTGGHLCVNVQLYGDDFSIDQKSGICKLQCHILKLAEVCKTTLSGKLHFAMLASNRK